MRAPQLGTCTLQSPLFLSPGLRQHSADKALEREVLKVAAIGKLVVAVLSALWEGTNQQRVFRACTACKRPDFPSSLRAASWRFRS